MRFRSNPASIRGSIAPVVTPFTADGAVDHDSLRGLIRWQLESGSHGISLGGYLTSLIASLEGICNHEQRAALGLDTSIYRKSSARSLGGS